MICGAATLASVFVLTPAAEAQSVFQKLFGFGGQTTPAAAPVALPRPRQILLPRRFHRDAPERQSQRKEEAQEDIGPPDSGGPYKTICVRTCDGFYFPIRHGAHHKNFASDVQSCTNACGAEARLFYYSLNGPEGADGMLDLSGRSYAGLQHAFAYRKKLVQGCTCKPAPWSAEEVARHQSYAAKELEARTNDEAVAKTSEVASAEPYSRQTAALELSNAEALASDQLPEVHVASSQPEISRDRQPPAAPRRIGAAEVPPLKVRRVRTYAQRAQFKPAAPSLFTTLFGDKPKYVGRRQAY